MRGKAAEDCRTPTPSESCTRALSRSVLECGSPLPLLVAMSFLAEFNSLPLRPLLARSREATPLQVRHSLAAEARSLQDFANLISPAAGEALETLCRRSREVTRQRFGKVIRLFAPLYLSNECINNCQYCGFSRDNAILRVTLSLDEVVQEARALKGQGFRNLLLVAGEHPKFVSSGYLQDCVCPFHRQVPSNLTEIGPLQ